jgi:hypothetical protein
MVLGVGFWVLGLGFWVSGLAFRVYVMKESSGISPETYLVWCLVFRVYGLGFRV